MNYAIESLAYTKSPFRSLFYDYIYNYVYSMTIVERERECIVIRNLSLIVPLYIVCAFV